MSDLPAGLFPIFGGAYAVLINCQEGLLDLVAQSDWRSRAAIQALW